MELKGKKIAFLGDSITEGVGASAPEHLYWNVIAQKTGAQSFGYGISGTRIAPQRVPSSDAPSYDQYFASRVDEIIPDADVVVIFGGTNDFGHGDAALGKFGDCTEDTFYGAYHQLLAKLYMHCPNAQIVALTPLHREGEDDALYNSMGVRRAGPLSVYVQAIREVAQYYGAAVADLYRDCAIQPNFPQHKIMYCPDGLHPNDAGHLKIAQCVLNVLNSL